MSFSIPIFIFPSHSQSYSLSISYLFKKWFPQKYKELENWFRKRKILSKYKSIENGLLNGTENSHLNSENPNEK